MEKERRRLSIRSLDGRSITVHVDADCTVAALKATITELENVPVERQRLIFSARELEVVSQPHMSKFTTG